MKKSLPSSLLPLILSTMVVVLPLAYGFSTSNENGKSQHNNAQSRRSILSTLIQTTTTTSLISSPLLLPTKAFAKENNKLFTISNRINANELTMPPPSRASELNGIDNLYYPTWLSGTWDVTQTLVDASTPLGLKFIGGPSGSMDIAASSWKEQLIQLNTPINLQLRFVPTKFGVAEDRLFNTKQRLDNFAGRSVVASVQYANVGGSNRASVLALGGNEDTPLQTTLTYFKGPAAQKIFLLGHDSASNEEDTNFAAIESQRSIFALTNQNTAPPVTTDSESIWVFTKIDNDTVSAKLRIASYLNAQSDSLYFEARNKAVSFADYVLTMKRASL